MLTRHKSKLSLDSGAEISPDIDRTNRRMKRKTNTPSPRVEPKKCSTTKRSAEQREQRSKQKSDQTLNKKFDPKSFQSPQPQNGITPNIAKSPEAFACYNAIEQVLAMKYVNVHERLKLTFPAKCTQSLTECSQEHARNHYISMSNNIATSQTFLKNHQPLMFIHVILMDVLEDKFPGRHAIQSLLELILCIHEPPITTVYEVKKVIDMSAFTINSIFERFPPCWLAANKEYRTLLQTKGKKLITGSTEMVNTHTLFEDLMICIDSVIQVPARRPAPVEDNFNNSMMNDSMFNDSQDLQCFSKWESKNSQKYSFDDLPRDEKIDRIFLILALHVQLFEADLAMWTIRNIRNPSAKIFDSQKGPLIGSVLWSNDEPHQVNYCIKNILKLYVNYISIDFPSEHTHVLGRLVNIIFNVFDLYEFRLNKSNDDERVEYPQSTNKQSYFCDAFTKTIFDNSSCNVELWLKIIQNVEHPRLKLYLINALLTKIEHKQITLQPETIYTSLCELEKQYDDIFDKSNSHNNNVVKTKNSKQTAGDRAMKYPYLQRVNRRAASDLSYEQHAELHLVALRAYMKVFHIEEFQQYWKNYDRNEAERMGELERYKTELKPSKRLPFNLSAMKMLQKKPLDRRMEVLGQDRIFGLDVLNEDHLRFKPYVDTKKYRNDAKFVDMVATHLPKLHSKLGSLFPTPNSQLS